MECSGTGSRCAQWSVSLTLQCGPWKSLDDLQREAWDKSVFFTTWKTKGVAAPEEGKSLGANEPIAFCESAHLSTAGRSVNWCIFSIIGVGNLQGSPGK